MGCMALVYDYYPAVLHALELVGQGQSITAAIAQARITIDAFEKTVNSDPSLQNLLVLAERRGQDALADGLLTMHQQYKPGTLEDNPFYTSDSRMARVLSDNMKWWLEKRNNRKFGQKVEQTVVLTLDRAITDALDAARIRATRGTALIEHRQIEKAPALIEDAEALDFPYDGEDAAIMRALLR